MIFFFHHYELPTILQQARIQQIIIENQQQPTEGTDGSGGADSNANNENNDNDDDNNNNGNSETNLDRDTNTNDSNSTETSSGSNNTNQNEINITSSTSNETTSNNQQDKDLYLENEDLLLNMGDDSKLSSLLMELAFKELNGNKLKLVVNKINYLKTLKTNERLKIGEKILDNFEFDLSKTNLNLICSRQCELVLVNKK